VEQAIVKRSSMTAIGNLNDYVKYQMGQAMTTGGEGAAAATLPATMAMGFGMAQEMMKSMQNGGGGGAPAGQASDPFSPAAAQAAQAPAAPAAGGLQVLTPAQAAQVLGVSEADVLTEIQAGNLKARQIGSQWRIAQSALDEFLKG
jgi:excisionase family DNA binding protein